MRRGILDAILLRLVPHHVNVFWRNIKLFFSHVFQIDVMRLKKNKIDVMRRGTLDAILLMLAPHHVNVFWCNRQILFFPRFSNWRDAAQKETDVMRRGTLDAILLRLALHHVNLCCSVCCSVWFMQWYIYTCNDIYTSRVNWRDTLEALHHVNVFWRKLQILFPTFFPIDVMRLKNNKIDVMRHGTLDAILSMLAPHHVNALSWTSILFFPRYSNWRDAAQKEIDVMRRSTLYARLLSLAPHHVNFFFPRRKIRWCGAVLFCYCRSCRHKCIALHHVLLLVGWVRLVGSLKLYVSFCRMSSLL